VRLDTFASRQIPKNPPARHPSSAHTYRLLIVKDQVRIHYQTSTALQLPGTASFCVAASAAEKRDYEELSLRRQQVSATS
jgi:hypothetical protein